MKEDEKIHVLLESAEHAYSMLLGFLTLYCACMILIPNEVHIINEAEVDSFAKWYMRFGGFVFMLVTAMVMQTQLINIVKKVPSLSTFVTRDPQYITLILGVLLTIAAILLGWIIAYTPFIGYIVAGLFVLGYLSIVRKLSRSKSLIEKIFFILMTLIILLIMISIVAFLYLTRPG